MSWIRLPLPVRIGDFLDGPEAVAAALATLGRTYPGAIPYAAGPDRARRLGLRVSDEVGGIAVGLLDADDQAAHVSAWTLSQRDEVAAGRPGSAGPAAGVLERVPVLLFLERSDEDGVLVQWAVVGRARGYRN